MERIDGPGSYFLRPQDAGSGKKTESKKEKSGVRRTSFSDALGRASAEPGRIGDFEDLEGRELEEYLANLADQIHSLGSRLAKFPGRQNLSDYREAVAGFLAVLSKKAYALEEHESRRDILNQKRYVLVTRVNQKLEQLAVGMLETQADSLKILASVEEINGLLFDLLH